MGIHHKIEIKKYWSTSYDGNSSCYKFIQKQNTFTFLNILLHSKVCWSSVHESEKNNSLQQDLSWNGLSGSFWIGRTVSDLSGQFQDCLDILWIVWTVSGLSGHSLDCLDSFQIIQIVSKLTKPAGRSGAKLTENPGLRFYTPFHYAHKFHLRGGKRRKS